MSVSSLTVVVGVCLSVSCGWRGCKANWLVMCDVILAQAVCLFVPSRAPVTHEQERDSCFLLNLKVR